MHADFADICIVDLDLSKTTWSRVHETLRIMFLKLDREPPDNDWLRLFFEERETRIVARRRGLWIEDGYISFDALPGEIETIHLPDIRRSLEYANREYRKLIAQKAAARVGQQREVADERTELIALRERVRAALAGKPAAPVAAPTPRAAPPQPPVEPASTAAPAMAAEPLAAEPAAANEFDARRESLKQRFRLALNHHDKELERGND